MYTSGVLQLNKFSTLIEVEPRRTELGKNLRYWLENLEKKFVYNLCFDKYELNKAAVDDAIERYGLQNVRLNSKKDD